MDCRAFCTKKKGSIKQNKLNNQVGQMNEETQNRTSVRSEIDVLQERMQGFPPRRHLEMGDSEEESCNWDPSKYTMRKRTICHPSPTLTTTKKVESSICKPYMMQDTIQKVLG